jgi:hypothetical protein
MKGELTPAFMATDEISTVAAQQLLEILASEETHAQPFGTSSAAYLEAVLCSLGGPGETRDLPEVGVRLDRQTASLLVCDIASVLAR